MWPAGVLNVKRKLSEPVKVKLDKFWCFVELYYKHYLLYPEFLAEIMTSIKTKMSKPIYLVFTASRNLVFG